MSQDSVPGPESEAMPEADSHPGDVEETSEEHAHATDDAIPADRVEASRVHQETSPHEEPGDERAERG